MQCNALAVEDWVGFDHHRPHCRLSRCSAVTLSCKHKTTKLVENLGRLGGVNNIYLPLIPPVEGPKLSSEFFLLGEGDMSSRTTSCNRGSFLLWAAVRLVEIRLYGNNKHVKMSEEEVAFLLWHCTALLVDPPHALFRTMTAGKEGAPFIHFPLNWYHSHYSY